MTMYTLTVAVLVLCTLRMCLNEELKDSDDLSNNVIGGNEASIVSMEDFSQLSRLPRLDGVQVGHIQEIHLADGAQKHKVKTISLRPLMFEIPDFASERECNALIDMISQHQLQRSDIFQQSVITQIESKFENWDENKDGRVDWQEIRIMLMYMRDLHFTKEGVQKLISNIGGKVIKDCLVAEEFDGEKIFRYLDHLQKENPYVNSRYSNQTYLENSLKAMKVLNKRKAALMGLPLEIIQGSETSVAIHYEQTGHYHCHYDSQDDYYGLPCCGRKYLHNCKICRYITIILYLNDVHQGGETAFPIASPDGSTKPIPEDNGEFSNLSEYCHKARLKIAPKRGSAVIWYNHLVDDATGWIGGLDNYSYHGGCDVIKGDKWIINSWVNVIGDNTSDVRTWQEPSIPIVSSYSLQPRTQKIVHDEI